MKVSYFCNVHRATSKGVMKMAVKWTLTDVTVDQIEKSGMVDVDQRKVQWSTSTEKSGVVDVGCIFHDLLFNKKCSQEYLDIRKISLLQNSTSTRKNAVWSTVDVDHQPDSCFLGQRQAALFITPKFSPLFRSSNQED